jgi:hypothetical protein
MAPLSGCAAVWCVSDEGRLWVGRQALCARPGAVYALLVVWCCHMGTCRAGASAVLCSLLLC